MTQKNLILMAVACLILSTGCGAARIVRTVPGKSGEIALLGEREDARKKAQVHMAEICGRLKPEIIEEGEAVVGTVNSGNSNYQRTSFGIVTTDSGETTQKTEWRIKFECK